MTCFGGRGGKKKDHGREGRISTSNGASMSENKKIDTREREKKRTPVTEKKATKEEKEPASCVAMRGWVGGNCAEENTPLSERKKKEESY